MNFNRYFHHARYVCAKGDVYFPYIRKKFTLDGEVRKATLFLSALGFCEIYCNNRKITEDLFVTPLAEYNPPDAKTSGASENDPFFGDELSYSIYVSEFDVTPFLRAGENAFGAILAGGWYRSGVDKHGAFRNFGKTKLCFRLMVQFCDGTVREIVSDGDCRWKPSFLTQSGVFHEEQDERAEICDFSDFRYDDSDWDFAETVSPPDSKYLLNDCPPDRIVEWIRPKLVKQTATRKIYDLGKNVTGFAVIGGASEVGDRITCDYSEKLGEDGFLDEFHSYKQSSVFVSDGRREHFIRFTWHGFRYVQVSTDGNCADLCVEKCAVVHADIRNTSFFRSDDEILNFLYDAYIRTQLENFHCGVPTDCPQIERKGYTGDGQLLCELGMTLFDSRRLYKKWINDICDVQDRKTGFVHHTAPCFIGCSGGPGGWGVAIVNVPYAYYKIYGDPQILSDSYEHMRLYLKFMDDESVDGLVRMHRRAGPCLGDWNGPVKPYLPEEFVNSCLYAEALVKMREIAEVCGKERDAEAYRKRAIALKQAITDRFFDARTGDFCNNEQGANAFALNVQLGDERTLENLARRYGEIKTFDTGIFGTKILTKVLFENGFPEIALSLYRSRSPASFYGWMKDGATTLYESWENPRSLNHPMFGSVVLYLFEYVLGIRQSGECGYRSVLIQPTCVDLVPEVSGGIDTGKGRISVSYRNTGEEIRFAVDLPEGVDGAFRCKRVEKSLRAGRNEFVVRRERG